MTLEQRIGRLEEQQAEGPKRILVVHLKGEGTETRCEAPPGLSTEEHQAWHQARGDRIITVDPSSGSRRDDADWGDRDSCPANRRGKPIQPVGNPESGEVVVRIVHE